MTPRELNAHVAMYSEQMETEGEEKLRLAHITAYWQRIDVLKSFEEMTVQKQQQSNNMSDMEMLANAHKLTAMMNGTIAVKTEDIDTGDA